MAAAINRLRIDGHQVQEAGEGKRDITGEVKRDVTE